MGHSALRWVTGLLSLPCIALYAVGCGSEPSLGVPTEARESSPTPAAQVSPAVGAPVPRVAAGCPALVSDGLGLSRREWERRVGDPLPGSIRTESGAGTELTYARYTAPRGTYEAGFVSDTLFQIGYRLDRNAAPTEEQVEAVVRPLLPEDAEPVGRARRQALPGGERVLSRAYSSEALFGVFGGPNDSSTPQAGCRPPGSVNVRGVPIRVDVFFEDGGQVARLISLEFFAGG